MPGATSNLNTGLPTKPSAAEAAAKAELEKRGYTGMKRLARDPAGNWAGKTMRNNVESLEPNGSVRAIVPKVEPTFSCSFGSSRTA